MNNSIRTDSYASILRSNIDKSQQGLSKTLARMSSGLKVLSAKDDASGAVISARTNVELSGINIANNNIQVATSMFNVAQDALFNAQNILTRLRDLSLMAADSSYDKETRKALQDEADALTLELEKIQENTKFKDINLFNNQKDKTNKSNNNSNQQGGLEGNDLGGDIGNIDDDSGGGGAQGDSGGKTASPLSVNTPLNRNLNTVSQTSLTNPQGDSSMRSFGVLGNANENNGILDNANEENGISDDENLGLNISSGMKLMSAGTGLRGAQDTGIVADNEENDGVYITGAFDFAKNEEYKINIDGVTYTVKNRNATTATISYKKEIATGIVTFTCNTFTITGQSDVNHNIVVNGKSNWIYGGDLVNEFHPFNNASTGNKFYGGASDEVFNITGYNNYYYGQGGNDTFNITADTSTSNYCYGGAGNDIFNHDKNGTQYYHGEDGDDIFNINGNSARCYGENNNDTFNLTKGNSTYLYGGKGDDNFTIAAGCSSTFVDGGAGTNNMVNNGTNTTAANVVGANSYTIDFAKNEQKDIVINVGGQDITYTVKNRTSAQQLIIQIQDDNRVDFLTGNFTITGQSDVAHYVGLMRASIYFYGGDLDDRVYTGSDSQIVDTGEGNDTIIHSGGYSEIYTGNGDDTVYMRSYYSGIYTGDGDDTIIYNGNYTYNYFDLGNGNDTVRGENTNGTVNNNRGFSGCQFIAGEGTDSFQLTGSSANNSTNYLKDGFDSSKYSTFEIGASETKNLVISTSHGDYTYSIKNGMAHAKTVKYYYDEVEDKIYFAGDRLTITGETTKVHNVNILGSYVNFYGGDLDDNITAVGGYNNYLYGQGGNDTLDSTTNGYYTKFYGGGGEDNITVNGTSASVYGEAGNDTITINTTGSCSACNGGEGNDSYYISKTVQSIDDYGDNVYYIDINDITLSAGAGNDTFYITGNNNNIAGGGGDDYFIVSGTGNTIDGGTGTNYIVDNGEGNIKPNTDVDPNSGGLTFTYVGEQHSFSIADKMYMVKNSTETADGIASNNVTYTYNQNTGEIIFTGNNLTITACDGMSHNIRVEGNNNTIAGGDCPDTIIVNSGTNNLVKGNAGNDNITLNSANNAIQAGSGNDNVSVNASTNKEIDLGDGNDTIYLNANNNTNINTGAGNDTVRSSSATSGNTITLNNGNNDLLLTGSNNTISSGSGNNRISVIGNENEISTGSGNNILGARGDSNTLRAEGNTTFNVQGSDNSMNLTGNNNIVNSTGNNADITSIGNNSITSKGANSSVNSIGKSTINVVGDNSEVTSIGNSTITTRGENVTLNSIGKSTINQSGDSATIETQTGNVTLTGSNATLNAAGANLNITGNNNEINNIIEDEDYNSENEVEVEINIDGNENNLTTNNTSDNVKLSGNSNTLNLNNLNDTVESAGDNNNISFTDGKNSVKLRGNSNNVQGGLGSESFRINSGSDNVFEGGETTQKNTIYDLGENTVFNNCVDVTPRPLYVDVQVGYDPGESIRTKLQFLLGDFYIDVSDIESANESIKRVDEVLDEINTQLSSIGSQLNRFESIFELNNNTRVNLESKNSLIVDCDIAKESVNYAMDSIKRDISASIFTQIEGLRRDSLMNLVYGAVR